MSDDIFDDSANQLLRRIARTFFMICGGTGAIVVLVVVLAFIDK